MIREKQASQVIEAMRKEGGYATLRRLNEIVDSSTWGTKTPKTNKYFILVKYELQLYPNH